MMYHVFGTFTLIYLLIGNWRQDLKFAVLQYYNVDMMMLE
jgi:hypothetical protein